jgi:hypothetical protein
LSLLRCLTAFFGAVTENAGAGSQTRRQRDLLSTVPGDAKHLKAARPMGHGPERFVNSGEDVAGSMGEFIGRMVGWTGQFPVKTVASAL